MTYRYLLLCLLLLPLSPLSAQKPTPPKESETESKAILTQRFDLYRTALVNKDGETAQKLLSKDSLSIYENYRLAALTGTKEEILQIPLVHQAAVLILRGSLSPEVLAQTNGADIYARAINDGLIAHKWAESMQLMDISFLDANAALLTIGVKSQPGTRMVAVKENGTWKFSLREVLMESNKSIIASLEEKKIPQEAYLKLVVETALPNHKLEDLWSPPGHTSANRETPWQKEIP